MRFYSHSLTSSMWFEREKPCTMMTTAAWCSLAAWSDWQGPAVSAKRLTHTHTHTYIQAVCSSGCRAIWPMHIKRLDVVGGEVLEFLCTFQLLWITLCCCHMTQWNLLLPLKNETTQQPLKEDLTTSTFFSPLVIKNFENSERRGKRFRSESGVMCLMENKQEEICLQMWIQVFWESKKPQRQRFHQMNRYLFSKDSGLVAGKGQEEGRLG